MNKYISLLMTLVLAASLCSGCFRDSEDETDNSGMSLVTAAKLGTLKRTMVVQREGKPDTISIVSVNGNLYPLTIDQVNHVIYNADPLPYNTWVDKVVFSTFNVEGSAAIKSLVDGKDTTFVAKDSTDFRQPRQITVYGYDGESRTTYTVDIRCRKEQADSMQWSLVSQTQLPTELTDVRLLACGEVLHLWGRVDNDTWHYTAHSDRPQAWTGDRVTNNVPEPQTIVQQGLTFYGLNATDIVSSTDGQRWVRNAARTEGITTLIGTTTRALYALSTQGYLRSENGGSTWTLDADDEHDSIPVNHISYMSRKTRSNEAIEEALLVGNTQSGRTVVWKRNEMSDPELDGTAQFQWNHLASSADNKGKVPNRLSTSLADYDSGALLAGLDSEGHVSLLMSYDTGRSWSTYPVTAPEVAEGLAGLTMAVDAHNYIWLYCTGTGQLWQGRLSRLGWEPAEDVFLKTRQHTPTLH